MSTFESIDSAGTASLAFLEDLFEQFQNDPASVEPEWRAYFESLIAAGGQSGARPVPSGNGKAGGNGQATAGAARPRGGRLVTPDGIATAHAVAISNGAVQLPAAPPGEAMPLPLPPVAHGTQGEERVAFLQDRVDQLVRAYRVRGHLMAEIDPLGRPRPGLPELDPDFYHLTEEDMDRSFSTDKIGRAHV